MQRIKLEQAQPGMILAKRVENDKGMTLCKEGTEITDSILLRFENAGIGYLSVEGRPVHVEGEKSLPDLLRELDGRFEKVADDPTMGKIHRIIARRLEDYYGDEEDPSPSLQEGN